jgi:hypothetical protein
MGLNIEIRQIGPAGQVHRSGGAPSGRALPSINLP